MEFYGFACFSSLLGGLRRGLRPLYVSFSLIFGLRRGLRPIYIYGVWTPNFVDFYFFHAQARFVIRPSIRTWPYIHLSLYIRRPPGAMWRAELSSCYLCYPLLSFATSCSLCSLLCSSGNL